MKHDYDQNAPPASYEARIERLERLVKAHSVGLVKARQALWKALREGGGNDPQRG